MVSDEFMKEYLWVVVLAVLLLTAFIGYALNKNIDPNEVDNEEEENNLNSNNDEQDNRTDSRED